ncbi:MAG: ABC transporter permease [Bacteroidales bacterium]|nr:ABC transporter permease [Bacteroidales bacterium]
MFKNAIKTSFRFLKNNRIYTLINIFGLALGLATSMLIFLFVSDEVSYDKFHDDYQDIYRVQEHFYLDDYDQYWATCDGSMAYSISKKLQEGSHVCKIMSYFNPPFLITDEHITESGKAIFADSSFFDVFSYPLADQLEGGLLSTKNQVLISEKIANELFQGEIAIGKTFIADDEEFEVSAVFANIPTNSHMHFDVVFSMELLRETFQDLDSIGPMVFYTYVRTSDDEARIALQLALQGWMDAKVAKLITKDVASQEKLANLQAEIVFMPLVDIHLKGHAEKEYETNGNMDYILIYLTIAFFILALASINYVNLATASSVKRAKEVGVRKIMGANRRNVFLHFISEAFILVLSATLLSLVFVEMSFPSFNDIAGKELNISMIWEPNSLMYLVTTIMLLTVLSGLYPSVFMSRFNPLKVLSNRLQAHNNNRLNLIMRRVLVVSQFVIAIFLTIASFTVGRQLSFIQNKDVGFDREQVLVIPLNGESAFEHLKNLKADYLDMEGVISVTGSSNIPGERFGFYGIYMPSLAGESDTNTTKDDHKNWLGLRMLCADKDFLSSFGLEIIEGRTFSADVPSDTNAFILNEAAVRKYNITDPIGKEVVFNYAVETPKHGKIIGIVKDFHYASFHSEVDPLMVQILPPFYRYLIIKIENENKTELITNIESKWRENLAHTPFRYFFLNQAYENIYSSDKRMGKVFYYFTFVALFLASLGLYGLVAFIAEQRKSEVGIRKVLGASIAHLLFAMSKEFVVLILISNIIAWVPAYFFINNWLNGFAFRVGFSVWPFVLTAFLSVCIGLVTISIKTWLSAKASPVAILKSQ